MENKKMILYSYTKVWNVEKKVYNIGNIILPVPVELWSAACFAGTACIIYLLQKIFPALLAVPALVRLGAAPYGLMYFVRRIRLDGKNPVKYFAGMLRYLACERYAYQERFVRHAGAGERIKLHWSCSGAFETPPAERKI